MPVHVRTNTRRSKSGFKNQDGTLGRTVSIAERKEPGRRWEKVPGGHLAPWHRTDPGFKAGRPDGCLASLKRHTSEDGVHF